MRREQVEIEAPSIGGAGTVIGYGHYGRPVLLFPAEQGRAWDLDPSDPRLMADLARAFGQKATLAGTAAEREKYFNRACALFEQASVLDPKNGHSYGCGR